MRKGGGLKIEDVGIRTGEVIVANGFGEEEQERELISRPEIEANNRTFPAAIELHAHHGVLFSSLGPEK